MRLQVQHMQMLAVRQLMSWDQLGCIAQPCLLAQAGLGKQAPDCSSWLYLNNRTVWPGSYIMASKTREPCCAGLSSGRQPIEAWLE